MTIRMNAKCSDMFWAQLLEGSTQKGQDYDGYVPDWMPGEHGGGYVELEIEVATGRILNWKRPTSKQLAEAFKFKRGVSTPKSEGSSKKNLTTAYSSANVVA